MDAMVAEANDLFVWVEEFVGQDSASICGILVELGVLQVNVVELYKLISTYAHDGKWEICPVKPYKPYPGSESDEPPWWFQCNFDHIRMTLNDSDRYATVAKCIANRILWNSTKQTLSNHMLTKLCSGHPITIKHEKQLNATDLDPRTHKLVDYYAHYVGTVTLKEADPTTGSFWRRNVVEYEFPTDSLEHYQPNLDRPISRPYTFKQLFESESHNDDHDNYKNLIESLHAIHKNSDLVRLVVSISHEASW